MNKLSTHQQQFGDLNRQLNRMRAQMNKDFREECLEARTQGEHDE
ncbi:MAG: hypothetical protein Q7S65_00905 [Nanoarchaeota archaeon]|nr:hypothetical protein [Nanoarchaeota archaeon]